MEINKEQFKQINRQHIIRSDELKKTLHIVGEIISINLYQGRSPNDIEEGKDPDLDEWEINTIEVKEEAEETA